MIAHHQRSRFGQVQSNEPAGPRPNRLVREHAQPNRQLIGAHVHRVRTAPRHVVIERGQRREGCIEHRGQVPIIGSNDGMSASNFAVFDTAQVECHPMTGLDRVDRTTVSLDASDPYFALEWLHHNVVADGE